MARPRLLPFVAVVLLGLAAVLLPVRHAHAESGEECMECHGDEDFTTERDGEEVSLYVDPDRYAKSAHADVDCVFCHQDLDGTDYPHATDLEPVNCAECHEDEAERIVRGMHGPGARTEAGRAVQCWDCHGTHDIRKRLPETSHADLIDCGTCHQDYASRYAKSTHGVKLAEGDEMAPFCWDCHGTHDIRPSADTTSPTSVLNIPAMCGQCHQEGSPVSRTHEIAQASIFENYSQSIHGEGLFRKGLKGTAVCTSCHTSHDILPHEDPSSSINPQNVVATCEQCHGLIEQVHEKVVEGRLWEEEPGKIPICVECHSPHRLRGEEYYEQLRATNESCLKCHGEIPDPEMVREGRASTLKVDMTAFGNGSHSEVTCAQCHTEATAPTDRPCMAIQSPVDCSICHAEVVTEYQRSAHGQALAAGDADAPSCRDCHDQHATLSKKIPTSPTFPRNIPELCARCHLEGAAAATRIQTEVPVVEGYMMSIHGKGLKDSGLLVTATCVNCHSAHGVLPSSDPGSKVHDDRVADTCGQCHHGIEEEFRKSIHWPGNGAKEGEHLPNCKDCHTSHTIARTGGGNFRLLMMEQCGNCHQDEASTFFDTYHGKVSRLGGAAAAKCYDCHGTHNIHPASDPASTLSHENVVATCAQCHQAAHRRFAGYLTHATHHDPGKYPWLFWTFWGMTALLVGTLSVALLHTGAWLFRLYRSRDEWKAHKAAVQAEPGEKLYRRFNRYERVQHILMLLSFFTLAITGMALKFSYMGWAHVISDVIGGFERMGSLHRFAAVILFGVFVSHIIYVVRKKQIGGGTWKEMLSGPDSLLFTKTDLVQFGQSMKWFFGKGPRPKYGRWTYWEKFDYFAVFWGVFIIGATGMILWFPEFFTHIVPGWFINVATIIHSDEALLAVGFIFTIHFFNTHFRPDKFPMDSVIFTGRVPLKELQQDKPGEYEAMKASGRLEQRLVDPFPKGAEKGFRIFGFAALTVGILLIIAIVYSMLFTYR